MFSSFHIAQMQVGLGEPHRVGQAREVRLVLGDSVPMQIDGEPWEQHPAEITLTHHNQVSRTKDHTLYIAMSYLFVFRLMLFSYPRGDLLGEVPPLQLKPKLFVGLDVFLLYVAIINVIRCDNLSCCVHPINIMLYVMVNFANTC